jgi:hypothetical protein
MTSSPRVSHPVVASGTADADGTAAIRAAISLSAGGTIWEPSPR